MPIEDDPAFQNPGPRPDPRALERRRYQEMTPEERREAWARLREAQGRRARTHGRMPVILGVATIAAFAVGFFLPYAGHPSWARVALWTGTGLAGFTIIAVVRHMMGSLAKRREDLGPPGL